MAFQRPFLISLKRSDPSQKWGFSIQGGSDQGEPLSVQQVAEGSLSERCGLRQGDELIQVGRVNVQDLPMGQVYELLARCGNKIEMFVVREDLLTPRKGKEPPVVKAVVHNPYNSPLSLYSAENVADTLGKQAEVLTEGHISTEEDEGPESLSFKQKSAVFQLLEEQSKQDTAPISRVVQQSTAIKKPKSAPPPPPPKPKPPVQENLQNGYHQESQYSTQYQRGLNQYETPVQQQYQQGPLRENLNYQQVPGGYQVTYQSAYQTSSTSPGSPVVSPQQYPGNYQYQVANQNSQGSHSPVTTGQQAHYVTTRQESHRSTSQQQTASQQQYTSSYQQQRQPPAVQQSTVVHQQQSVAYQQPSVTNQQSSVTYQQPRSPGGVAHQTNAYQQEKVNYQQQQQRREQERPQQQQSVSKAEFKIGPPPPARSSSNKHQHTNREDSNMTAIYKQQYEQHLQKQYEQEQLYLNQLNQDDGSKPRAHIIEGEIFEHNSTSGTPITYKTPPAAPPKPVWPPTERGADFQRVVQPGSPNGMNVAAAWPPKKSSAVELPRTGFNSAVVREQGTGKRCVWPPQEYEFHSGRNTPQSPISGRRIQWNPSPSPPLQRRTLVSPARRKDIPWPPPSPTSQNNFDKENLYRNSPRMSRKAQFDDYVHQHASINVPQTYRPPPGTQHVEFH